MLSGIAIGMVSYPLLLFSRLFTGFFAGNLTISLASIADLHNDCKNRSRDFALLTGIGSVSFIFAILIGGELSDKTLSPIFNPATPFFFTAILSLVNLFIIWRLFTEKQPDTQVRKKRFTQEFARLMGQPVDDEKYVERLNKHAGRNWLKYQ